MVIRMVAVITLSLSLIFVTSTVSPQEIEQEQVDSEEWYDPYNWFDTNGQFSRAFVDSPRNRRISGELYISSESDGATHFLLN